MPVASTLTACPVVFDQSGTNPYQLTSLLACSLMSMHIMLALASFGPQPLRCHCLPVGQLTGSHALTCIAFHIACSTHFTVCPFTCTVYVHWPQSIHTLPVYWYLTIHRLLHPLVSNRMQYALALTNSLICHQSLLFL